MRAHEAIAQLKLYAFSLVRKLLKNQNSFLLDPSIPAAILLYFLVGASLREDFKYYLVTPIEEVPSVTIYRLAIFGWEQ